MASSMNEDNARRNWERLVKAVRRTVPPTSVLKHLASDPEAASHINDILHVADQIEKEDPNVSLFLLEHALSLSLRLDPDCKERGVLRFKTGLSLRIKQSRAGQRGKYSANKRNPEYRKSKIATLEKFYRTYRDRHHSKLHGGSTQGPEDIRRRNEVKMTLQVLQDVIKEENELLSEEFRSIMDSDAKHFSRPYNILPPQGELLNLPEVNGAREELKKALKISIANDDQGLLYKEKDIFDALEAAFGFQPDNIRNQRENLVLLLANFLSYECDRNLNKVEKKDFSDAIKKVCDKILDNYKTWCLYIRETCFYNSVTDDETSVPLVALYLCIWGEAANIRFLPECICYIYHIMAKELLDMIKNSWKNASEVCEKDGGRSFLKAIIIPIYNALQAEAVKNKGGKAPHSKWRNYDDFNEFFWSRACFKKLKDWPKKKQSLPSFLDLKKINGDSTKSFVSKRYIAKKTSFVEHRTFLHLYHSFVRVWILLAMMLQALTIIAFTDGFTLGRLKILLSLGPTYFVMKFMESVMDIVMMFGAFSSSRTDAVARIFTHFLFYGGCSAGLLYLYWKMLLEESPSYFFLYITLWVVASYAALKLFISLLQHMPSVRKMVSKADKYGTAQTLKWLYKEQFYVGRGLFEEPRDSVRYVLFWVIVLACKFSFSYFLQIKPLADATKKIYLHQGPFVYAWHDFVSIRNHNALSLFSLWSPVVLIYLLDIQIWYTLFSAITGVLVGANDKLGEIRSLEMLRTRFESFPEAFVKKLLHDKPPTQQHSKDGLEAELHNQIKYAKCYAPFWNKIIECLREEDYITNKEKDLLIMPLEQDITDSSEQPPANQRDITDSSEQPLANQSFKFVKWPLFLVASKVFFAMKLVREKKDNPDEVKKRLNSDKYMSSAVAEAFESVHNSLCEIVNDEGKEFFEDVHEEVIGSYKKNSFLEFLAKNIESIHKKVTDLTKLLVDMDKLGQANSSAENQDRINKAIEGICEAVSHISPGIKSKLDHSKPACKKKISFKDAMKERHQRIHSLLTTTESGSTVPKNAEARRRLEFFTNSLFMAMPNVPSVRAMKSFSVLTPYYNEIVMYSMKDLQQENEDGITILFYLQKIFPDEWQNLLERTGKQEKALSRDHDNIDLRLWASYRGQTLARTVRGMMYYRRALMLQASHDRSDNIASEQAKNEECKPVSSGVLADYKFTYVVSCQIYGEQKKSPKEEDKAKANDILYLLKNYEGLRIAFIDNVDGAYYSKLVKISDDKETDDVVYSIKLPGNPKLGEGKPENQNHAVIFTRGHALQTIDMNQDNYLEEALKMRNLLEEFEAQHGAHKPTILGVREHIFTGSVSSLAWFMSNQETSFVTLGQRVLARPLKVRMHYGHPDVFDRLFHVTRGGISKASKTINVSEDIFAGFNSTLRNGNITHHEYIQVGKGRDVGLNQIAMFDAKVSSGNAEQLLSRDVYRLGQLFDFFRMLSFYVSSVGYYVCTMMTTLAVYFFLYGKAYLALSGVGQSLKNLAISTNNRALQTALDTQFLIQIGIFTAIPMLMEFILEEGIFKAIVNFITMQLQLCSVFFTFTLGTRTHYFGQTVLYGGAKYRETGRGFVVQHIKFADNYRMYSRSHFVKALEIIMLLLVIRIYGYDSSTLGYFFFSFFSWFLAISWLFAPSIFNPSGFEWQKTVEDFDNWTYWLLNRGGVGVNPNVSWESWWHEEQAHIRSPVGRLLESLLSLRFFLFQFGVVYHLHATQGNLKLSVYGVSWLVLVVVILIILIFSFNSRSSANCQLSLRLIQSIVGLILIVSLVVVVVLKIVTIGDVCASLLALIPTGWAILCIGIAWRPVVTKMGLWKTVRDIAWSFDAAMGLLIFFPIAVLSWFPFVSTFQTRLLFNQAFSRGLEISLILSGNRSNV